MRTVVPSLSHEPVFLHGRNTQKQPSLPSSPGQSVDSQDKVDRHHQSPDHEHNGQHRILRIPQHKDTQQGTHIDYATQYAGTRKQSICHILLLLSRHPPDITQLPIIPFQILSRSAYAIPSQEARA